jgi:hypothetical protein
MARLERFSDGDKVNEWDSGPASRKPTLSAPLLPLPLPLLLLLLMLLLRLLPLALSPPRANRECGGTGGLLKPIENWRGPLPSDMVETRRGGVPYPIAVGARRGDQGSTEAITGGRDGEVMATDTTPGGLGGRGDIEDIGGCGGGNVGGCGGGNVGAIGRWWCVGMKGFAAATARMSGRDPLQGDTTGGGGGGGFGGDGPHTPCLGRDGRFCGGQNTGTESLWYMW